MPQVWNWTQTKKDALHLIFEGRLSQAKIAEKCGVSTRAVESWVRNEQFKAELHRMREDVLGACDEMNIAYARKEQRVVALSQMAESAREQYEERPLLQEKRQIGYDAVHEEPLYLINESFNKDAHAAFRDSLDDIAKELGERRTNSNAVNVAVNLPPMIEVETTNKPPPEPEDPSERDDGDAENEDAEPG